MKNILQENMRRFGTKNLQEQEANVQTLTGKELKKQGYGVTPGASPIQDRAQYRVDPKLRMMSNTKDSSEDFLMAKLTPEQKQLIRMRQAHIMFRDLPSKIEAQYVELAK